MIGKITLIPSLALLCWLFPVVLFAQFDFSSTAPVAPLSTVRIIVESDTTTPVFYRGRAEPAAGSELRLLAVPAALADAENTTFRYEWRIDDRLEATSGDRLTMSKRLASDVTVSVHVYTEADVLFATEAIVIPFSEPEIHFYQHNPLRGLSRTAIPNVHYLSGSEVSINAVGYFFPGATTAADWVLTWSFDHQPITIPLEDPWVITLKNPGNSNQYDVSLFAGDKNNPSQNAERSFTFIGHNN